MNAAATTYDGRADHQETLVPRTQQSTAHRRKLHGRRRLSCKIRRRMLHAHSPRVRTKGEPEHEGKLAELLRTQQKDLARGQKTDDDERNRHHGDEDLVGHRIQRRTRCAHLTKSFCVPAIQYVGDACGDQDSQRESEAAQREGKRGGQRYSRQAEEARHSHEVAQAVAPDARLMDSDRLTPSGRSRRRTLLELDSSGRAPCRQPRQAGCRRSRSPTVAVRHPQPVRLQSLRAMAASLCVHRYVRYCATASKWTTRLHTLVPTVPMHWSLP